MRPRMGGAQALQDRMRVMRMQWQPWTIVALGAIAGAVLGWKGAVIVVGGVVLWTLLGRIGGGR